MHENRRSDLPSAFERRRVRPEGSLDLRLSGHALVTGPLVYLVGMIVAGILAANFLVNWLFGVTLFALLTACWVARDAARRGISDPPLWGLAAGVVPLAGIALYLMRREAPARRA